MKKILFIVLLSGSSCILGQSCISKIYSKILGNTDIRQEYKLLVYQALKDHGIANSENVSVKRMNSVGPLIALMPLSSFTAFGIWFDEEQLDSCSADEKTYQIYHEAAHYAKYHHQKLLGIGAGISALAIAGLIYLYKKLSENNVSHSSALTVGAAVLSIEGILGLLPYVVKLQEKEADIEAAKKLLLLNKAQVVKAHIQNLNQDSSQSGNIWWFSDKEQAAYLTEIIK